MSPNPRASAVLLTLLAFAPAFGWAKSADRNQPVAIDAGYQVGNFDDNGKTSMSQGVIIKQGTLDIRADAGELTMKNGDPSFAVFTGKPVKLRQQLDDGTWMDATADRMEYNISGEIITFIGNYTVSSPKGSNSGQKLVYNTKTSGMEAGGDGTRVRTVIKPKSAQNKATP